MFFWYLYVFISVCLFLFQIPGTAANSLFASVLAQVSGFTNNYATTYLRRWCLEEMLYEHERYYVGVFLDMAYMTLLC